MLMSLRCGSCVGVVLEHRFRNGVARRHYRCEFSLFRPSVCGRFGRPGFPHQLGLCSSVHNGGVPNEWDESKSGEDGGEKFDVSLARKKFPSIIVGNSLPVDLYDGSSYLPPTASPGFDGYFPDSGDSSWGLPSRLCESWSSLSLSLDEVDTVSGPSTEEIANSSFVNEADAPIVSGGLDNAVVIEDDLHDMVVAEKHSGSTSVQFLLDRPINCIPGLTKRQCSQLEKNGFHTLRKLLNHYPRTYADLQNAHVGIRDGQYLISVGKILSSRGVRAGYSFSFLEVIVGCEILDRGNVTCEHNDAEHNGKEKKLICLHLKKFFRGARFASHAFLRSLQEKHKTGEVVCVSGKVRTMSSQDHYEMREYHIDILRDDKEPSHCDGGKPFPIYPSKRGLNPDFIRDAILRALKMLSLDIDPIPRDITKEIGMLSLFDAYMAIHLPENVFQADSARKRLIFDEFFYLQLGRLYQMLEGLDTEIEKGVLLDRYRKPELTSSFIEEWSTLTQQLLKALPYELTPGQLTAISEIIWDLKQPIPMNRLLQGDVGCGKTVVAFLACVEVIGSGFQAAFMVPTELLAIQHYEHFLSLLENVDVECKPLVALLTGSTPARQSRIIREGLQNGDISLVIGTHSLIAEKVEFSALRIAVVDEQHRFGVVQRGRFNSKLFCSSVSSKIASHDVVEQSQSNSHMAPHFLAMSATPIPRTLALALYGDMSLTQISDLPPGRMPVETYVLEADEHGLETMYKMILDELEDGGKIYIVYPIIDQSELLPQLRAATADFEAMSQRFDGYKCGILHGRMRSDEKDEALRSFRNGETCILLSTQVIEIGVDVPDASMIVVMNAERFGMAQLHQLRGRVGRGTRKSSCILLASTSSSLTRLKVLENSSDGFHLANMDLLLRGPGDLLGKKQSGHLPEFPITRLEIDGNVLQDAHLAVLKILGRSPDLRLFPRVKAELSMRQPLSPLGD
ncbi:hypothetical protein MLD38_015107 [Melastoma candidum]|uniref:Uncharacterized protein n=1 Tax=Melastoma candidum TaxID=119954 RepID=A0ACB9RJ73_9MYRT|nr:hypothetical protein MLD38_015107 [Melastoma candidum]